jgi:beta-glucuronidase
VAVFALFENNNRRKMPMLNRLLLVGLMLCAAHSAVAAPLLGNIPGRDTTELNGSWRAIVDPYDIGYYDYRYKPRADGFFLDRKPADKAELVEYNFDTSPSLYVPGDWNSQRPELFLYEGSVWYKQSFDFQGEPNHRQFVHFGAANYASEVWLNGQPLGSHTGGFTPFNFEVTEHLKAKDNLLIVRVNNQRHHEGVPTINTDWWNYGGITRDVKLVQVPGTFIQDYFIQLKPESQHTVKGWVQLAGSDRAQTVRVRIPEAGISHTIKTNAKGYAAFEFPAEIALWSPQSPKLYDVEVVAETDQLVEPIGFRSLTTDGYQILLNGEPIFLRGISIHEEAPLREGRAFTVEDARTTLNWAKEMNANFVRLAHYPHNDHMARLADEMGLLVWAEIPVYWTIQWENPETLENAQRQLSEMITRDKNRASIAFWSMANETPLSKARLKFLRGLIDTARDLDDTRLITAALERHYIDDTTLMIDDPLGKYLDVLGVNEYIGWYDGEPEKAEKLSWKTTYNKPVVISEFGAGALAGLHGSEDERWTEEYQADVYRHNLSMLSRVPFVQGMSPWILKDFRSPRRLLPNIQDGWNRKGLISERGQRKQAFHVLQDFYSQKAQSQPSH